MIVPKSVTTLHELYTWVDEFKPKIIEVKKSSPITKLAEFNLMLWDEFRGITIIYT